MPVTTSCCRHAHAAICIVLGILLLPAGTAAQTSVTLEGRVLGSGGDPIRDAAVTAIEVATGERRTAISRANGAFRLLALSPGRYRVTASAQGHQEGAHVMDLVLGQRPVLRFDLVPAAVTLDPLAVQAHATLPEISRSSVSFPVLEQDMRNLPLSTRNAMDLAGLVPGMRSFRPLGGQSLPAAGALRGERFINVYVDGVQLKNLYDSNLVGFPHLGSPLPADALKEFRVYLHPYDPAYAHGASYVISAVTHRGTNRIEGSTFAFLQHRHLVAGNAFLDARPNFTTADFRRQHGGLTLRGPFVRDRLFYAASYELSNTVNYVSVVPPRPANDPGMWDEYAGVFPAPNRNHTGLLRLTWTPDAAHTLDAIGSVRRQTAETLFGGAVSRQGAVEDAHTVGTLNLRHRWIATPRLVNELSLQYVGWSNRSRALYPGPVLFHPGLRIGAPAHAFRIDERHLRVVDRLTRVVEDWHGNHVLNAGFEVARVSLENFFPNLRDGWFDFLPDGPLPVRARVGASPLRPDSDRDALAHVSGWTAGAYFSNEWRPTQRLSLTLGLRYDVELGLINNDLVVPWATDRVLAGMPQLQRYLNRGNRRNDLDNFSPRIAFSWEPFSEGRTAVRGGFGIIYDRTPGFAALQEQRETRWRTYVIASPGTTDPAALRQRVLSEEGVPTGFTLMANDIQAPENRQWSLGVGHSLTPRLELGFDVLHQSVRNLFAQLNLNWQDLSLTPPRRALSDDHGDIVVWDDFARARYRALLAQLTWQPTPDTRLNVAYTLGDAKADWDAANQSVPAAAAPTYYVMQRTSGDERHRVVVSGFAALPFRTRLSSIVTIASPRPYLAQAGRDVNRNAVTFDDWIGERRYLLPSDAWRNWYRVIDARLARDLPLAGTARLSAFVEVFNLLNTENYSSFDGNQQTAAGDNLRFRQPNGVFGTRQLQLGARVGF
jgi:hypothetical protein